MRFSLQRSLIWALSALPTAAILAVLGWLGWYGNKTDWKAPSLSHLLHPETKTPDEAQKKEKEQPEDAYSPLNPIKIPAEAAEQSGVKTKTAYRRQVGEYAIAHGEIDFNQYRYAHLTTRSAGIVWRVEKQPGDRVEKGDVLALIASAELARLKNDFQQAMFQVKQRQIIFERRQRASSALAGEQLIDASMALRDAKIRMLNDQQSLENLGLQVRGADLKNLEEEQISERLRLLDIPANIVHREGRERITSNLLPMRAPFAGEIMQRDMVRGEMVTSGPAQFVLADLSTLWLRLHLHQEDEGKVRAGQKVRFEAGGGSGEEAVGQVRRISAEVDPKTRAVLVLAEVDNSRGRLRPNTFGDGRIQIEEHPGVVVPSDAIQWDGYTDVVFVKTAEDEYQPHRVKKGSKEGKETEVIGLNPGDPGVRPGEQVVSEQSHILVSELRKALIQGED